MNKREFAARYLIDPMEIRIAEAEGVRVHDEIEKSVRGFGYERKVEVADPNAPLTVVDGRQRARAAKKFLSERAAPSVPQGGNRRQRRAAMRKLRKR